LKYYEQALTIDQKVDRKIGIARDFNNIGTVYQHLGQYDKAITYFEQAVELVYRLDKKDWIAGGLNNIGLTYALSGHDAKAVEYYEQALKLIRELKMYPEIAECLHNIGASYHDLEDYSKAISYFGESVRIIEQLRKTATGKIRREYLDSQIAKYQALTACYVLNNDVSQAFRTIELSRAKLLVEQIAGSDSVVNIPSLEQVQQQIPEDTAICIYANVGWGEIVRLIITKENIIASELSLSPFVQEIMNRYGSEIETIPAKLPGTKRVSEQGTLVDEDEIKKKFTQIIAYYYGLLYRTQSSNSKSFEQSKIFGNLLYRFLLGDIQEQFKRKTRLLIVPDEWLSFVPFETLLDDQGKYLVQHYQISYTQSLSILSLIQQQPYREDRKPLLAFGGAVYNAPQYETDLRNYDATQLAFLDEHGYSNNLNRGSSQQEANTEQTSIDTLKNPDLAVLVHLQNQIDESLKRRDSMQEMYNLLNLERWENLPGTLYEVNRLEDVIDGVEFFTGKNVTEAKIKALSADGLLANYKALHFAVHGVAVPELPELSALVLSQLPDPKNGEDGYLLISEIADLDIQADFVNLSACETGLGKLYSGEGVVGLTHAFLVAGAKGVSASLWRTNDVATAQFMVVLYLLVEEQGLSYAEAITEVKRRFIAGDFGKKWKSPYYWAPFVFYGES
jgi:CHAT domain-containing protein